jgi:hypothetical protein
MTPCVWQVAMHPDGDSYVLGLVRLLGDPQPLIDAAPLPVHPGDR